MPRKAENWRNLLHEWYDLKHRFLDTCRCAFKAGLSKHLLQLT